MNKLRTRKSRYYDGTEITTYQLGELVPRVLSKITHDYRQGADLIMAVWPEIIGPSLSPMAEATSFTDGVLTVKVKNSTLHSLLSQNEKSRLLNLLRQKFPHVDIKTIYFRIG